MTTSTPDRAPDGAEGREMEFPRRIRMDRWAPAEHAIHEAVEAVERTGADVRLTRAVMLLQEARTLVADFVDDDEAPAPQLQVRDRPRCALCMAAIPLETLAAGKGMLGGAEFICEDCADTAEGWEYVERVADALAPAPQDAPGLDAGLRSELLVFLATVGASTPDDHPWVTTARRLANRVQALSSPVEATERPAQGEEREAARACPVCGGRGSVGLGFYGDRIAHVTSSAAPALETCRTCQGTTVFPPYRAPASDSAVGEELRDAMERVVRAAIRACEKAEGYQPGDLTFWEVPVQQLVDDALRALAARPHPERRE